jgi:4-amino-4-deoxy-L-arabinose transferase-like glycosyltransferase
MYETMAKNLLTGDGLSVATAPPYVPTMLKEPFYPVVVALMKAVFGVHGITALLTLQILVNPLIAILIYLIGLRLFAERVARLSALLVAVIPIYGDASFSVMPEAFFLPLFLATIVLLMDLERRDGMFDFLLGGVLLALGSLFKNVLLPLAVLYPTVLLVKHRHRLSRRMILNAVVFVLAFAVVTTPWMWRNKQQLGLFAVSVRGGMLFADQASWAANFTAEEWKAYGIFLLSGSLAQRLYPHVIGHDLGEYEYKVLMRRDYVAELAKRYREGEIESLLALEGLRDFMRHPFKFAALAALVELQALKFLVPGSFLALQGPSGAGWLLPALRFSLLLAGILFTALTVREIVYCKSRLGDCWLLLGLMAYVHLASASLGIVPGAIMRYVMPVTLLYAFFIVIAVLGREAALRPRAAPATVL